MPHLATAETSPVPQERERDDYLAHALGRIRDALRGLRFGEVTLIVQDGVVVQVERTEKLRLFRGDRQP